MTHPIHGRGSILAIPIQLVGAAVCWFVEAFARETNGSFGFPLDDAWIHLQFARNLHDYGVFSYFRNEVVTSGSTSPLYTFLLSIGFFFTKNEMILSYFLGISFFLLAAFILFRILFQHGDHYGVAALGTLLFIFEPHLQWIALSGMETTLFIFLLLATWHFYRNRKTHLIGIGSGLLIWTRPEGFIFVLALALDVIYHSYIERKESESRKGRKDKVSLEWLKVPVIQFALAVVLYVSFNLWLSGSLFPNTLAAKMKYYGSNDQTFPGQVFQFLTADHFQFFAIFVAVGLIRLGYAIFRRKSSFSLVPFLFSVGLFLAFWDALPKLYQEGRYMMPILPFFIILGLEGVRLTIHSVRNFLPGGLKQTAAVVIILAAFSAQFAVASYRGRSNYADYCGYITDRQVLAGRWIHDHLPENAIVATHDIGAIAYYSGRRVVDMVGLISPDMIDNIGSFDKLRAFLIRKKVTHLAVLRNWFEVDNQPLLFHTDEQHPEILDIMVFDPRQSHFVAQDATRARDAAIYYFSLGDYQQAELILRQAVSYDPSSSRTHYWLGNTFLSLNNLQAAQLEFQNALQLYPQFPEAASGLAGVFLRNNKPAQAISILERAVQDNPEDAEGFGMLAAAYRDFHIDSAKANKYQSKYEQLIRERTK